MMMVLMVMVMMVLFLRVLVAIFDLLDPCGRTGYVIEVEHTRSYQAVEIHIAVVTLDNLCLRLDSTDDLIAAENDVRMDDLTEQTLAAELMQIIQKYLDNR